MILHHHCRRQVGGQADTHPWIFPKLPQDALTEEEANDVAFHSFPVGTCLHAVDGDCTS